MKINIDMMCLISAIIDKMEIDSNFFKKFFEEGQTKGQMSKQEKEILQKKIGAEVLVTLGKKLHLVKDELIQFISLYKEITEEEAKKIDIIEFIKEIAKDNGLKSFLKQEVMSE